MSNKILHRGFIVKVNNFNKKLQVRIPTIHGNSISSNRVLNKDLPWYSSIVILNDLLLKDPTEEITEPTEKNIVALIYDDIVLGILNTTNITNEIPEISEDFIKGLFNEEMTLS